jgi:hypothetical protein
MSNVVFYKDSVDTFECDIKIDGASSSKSKARLVLEFSDRTLLFNGKIDKGHVSVKIPKLSEVSDESGRAILEIIAEQTYFEAWESPFDLKNKKSVSIKEVIVNSDANKIIVENVSKSPTVEKRVPAILKESCTDKNAKFVSESFARFNSLDERERSNVKKSLREFAPKQITKSWASTVFKDPSSQYAKYCMMRLQNIK